MFIMLRKVGMMKIECTVWRGYTLYTESMFCSFEGQIILNREYRQKEILVIKVG